VKNKKKRAEIEVSSLAKRAIDFDLYFYSFFVDEPFKKDPRILSSEQKSWLENPAAEMI